MFIPVIDLFAGPGGLSEGFDAFRHNHKRTFRICLAVESDPWAHETLKLRSFLREFAHGNAPRAYYQVLANMLGRDELFKQYPRQAKCASNVACFATLGSKDDQAVSAKIRMLTGKHDNWVLLGGPPCQAYSLVGRSRNGGTRPTDARLFMFREYQKILAKHRPAVFVLENVKGLLSASVEGDLILSKIMSSLINPASLFAQSKDGIINTYEEVNYRLHSLVVSSDEKGEPQPADYVIKSEHYGIPQARHRIIIVGVRSDLRLRQPKLLSKALDTVGVKRVLAQLPRIRSGLSKQADSKDSWRNVIAAARDTNWYRALRKAGSRDVYDELCTCAAKPVVPQLDRGKEYIEYNSSIEYCDDWYVDLRLEGVCNHSSRAHIASDLHRYLFASCYAKARGVSPELSHFPEDLLPSHRNVKKALSGSCFADRFRVQVKSKPATTITSPIGRDGHYYIHHDPSQCGSLTVREATWLQTLFIASFRAV